MVEVLARDVAALAAVVDARPQSFALNFLSGFVAFAEQRLGVFRRGA